MKKKKLFEVSLINKTHSKPLLDGVKFYTSDTALELNFQLKEVEYDFDSAEIILLNIDDRSLATRPVVKNADGFTYELEDDIVAHYGEWKCQLKFNEGGEIYVSSPVSFRIDNDLNNDRPPKLTEVNTWKNLREIVDKLIIDLQIEQDETLGFLENRQDTVESKFDLLQQEMTNKDVISAPEIIAARNGEETLKSRLDKEQQSVNTLLNKTTNTALNNIQPLVIETFDGSYQPYHPSVKFFSSGWNGYKYWMAFTPFPTQASPYKDRWESPSIVVSNDGLNWVIPTGLTNPIIDLTPSEISRRDYFSDPSLVMNMNTMELWFRKTNGSNPSQTDIYRVVSDDGINWSIPQMVVNSQNTGSGITSVVRSQQVFYENDLYRMYWDDGNAGVSKRRIVFAETGDPSSGVWENLTEVNLINPLTNFNNWHTGVHKDGTTYHFVSYDQQRKTIEYFTSENGVDLFFEGTILEATHSISDLYLSYPLKVGSNWKLYTGITKNNKNGIMLFEGSSLLSLEGVSGGRNEGVQTFTGDVVLGNNSNINNASQKLFTIMQEDNKKYGFGMNLQTKEPLYINEGYSNSEIIPTVLYSLPVSTPPERLGQFLRTFDGSLYISIRISENNYAWRAVYEENPINIIDAPASSSINSQSADIIYLSATGTTTINNITNGVIGKKVVLTNKSNYDITLAHAVGENLISTQTKENYIIRSSSSVQLIAVLMSGTLRWHII